MLHLYKLRYFIVMQISNAASQGFDAAQDIVSQAQGYQQARGESLSRNSSYPNDADDGWNPAGNREASSSPIKPPELNAKSPELSWDEWGKPSPLGTPSHSVPPAQSPAPRIIASTNSASVKPAKYKDSPNDDWQDF